MQNISIPYDIPAASKIQKPLEVLGEKQLAYLRKNLRHNGVNIFKHMEEHKTTTVTKVMM